MERSRYSRLIAFGAAAFIAALLVSSEFLLLIGPWGFIALLFSIAIIAAAIARRRTDEVDPVRVYAMLLSIVLFCLAAILALSTLGPFGIAVLAAVLIMGNVLLNRRDNLRSYRANAGLCVDCGFDLRETTELCPECGKPLPEELLRRRRIAAAIAETKHGQLPLNRQAT